MSELMVENAMNKALLMGKRQLLKERIDEALDVNDKGRFEALSAEYLDVVMELRGWKEQAQQA